MKKPSRQAQFSEDNLNAWTRTLNDAGVKLDDDATPLRIIEALHRLVIERAERVLSMEKKLADEQARYRKLVDEGGTYAALEVEKLRLERVKIELETEQLRRTVTEPSQGSLEEPPQVEPSSMEASREDPKQEEKAQPAEPETPPPRKEPVLPEIPSTKPVDVIMSPQPGDHHGVVKDEHGFRCADCHGVMAMFEDTIRKHREREHGDKPRSGLGLYT